MFARVLRLVTLAFAATSVISSPIDVSEKRSIFSVSSTTLVPVSLNGWGGFSSLNNFDDFFGLSNFLGLNNAEVLLEQQLVCGVGGSSLSVDIVQQQLAVLAQVAQQAILTQLCEVEVQMLALQQFLGGLGGFSNDLLRIDGSVPSFDAAIAALGSSLFLPSGGFNTNFGFNGLDIGQNSQIVTSNWGNQSSQSVANALAQAQIAALASQSNNRVSFNNNSGVDNSNVNNSGLSNNVNNSGLSSNVNSNVVNSSNALGDVAAANGSSD